MERLSTDKVQTLGPEDLGCHTSVPTSSTGRGYTHFLILPHILDFPPIKQKQKKMKRR